MRQRMRQQDTATDREPTTDLQVGDGAKKKDTHGVIAKAFAASRVVCANGRTDRTKGERLNLELWVSGVRETEVGRAERQSISCQNIS